MTDFVRVLLENGSKASISAAAAENAGYTPLDEDALDHRGRPRGPEFPEVAPEGYEPLTIDRLHALIDERNEGREDSDKLSKVGKKADLIAALEADDNNPSS